MRWISLLQKVSDGELNDELMSWIKTSQIDFFFLQPGQMLLPMAFYSFIKHKRCIKFP